MTKVIFRADKADGEVTAVFPQIPATRDAFPCACYAHDGQHGSCTPHWLRDFTRPAKPAEYAALLAELQSIGYDDLRIVHRLTYADYLIRKEEASR